MFCHRDYLDFPVPGEDVDFDDVAGRRASSTVDLALCGDRGKARAAQFERECPPTSGCRTRGIEVGHIFYFGTKYSEPMKAVVTGPDGVEQPVQMGSYGIGLSRLVAAIIEASHDEAGIKWPEAVAPFQVAMLNLKQGDAATDAACEQIYRALRAAGVDVALPRPRRAAGLEIRDRRPDRHPLAGPGRPERAGRRQGRAQGAPTGAASC